MRRIELIGAWLVAFIGAMIGLIFEVVCGLAVFISLVITNYRTAVEEWKEIMLPVFKSTTLGLAYLITNNDDIFDMFVESTHLYEESET